MLHCSLTLFVSTFLAYAASQRNGDVRLVGDPSVASRGRVEVYSQGNWTSICFDYTAVVGQVGVAQAVCRQIGYYDVIATGNVTTLNLTQGTHTDKLGALDCILEEDPSNAPQHVFRCSSLGGQCDHGDDMAIVCLELREDHPFDTMVDFYNHGPTPSDSTSEGFVQVYVNQAWGPVCSMGMEDANTFCRQLSYTGALKVVEADATLQNSELVNKFHCTSSQACLRNCYDYPSNTSAISCPDGYSYVTCTFEGNNDEILESYGTKATCTKSSNGGGGGSSHGGTVAGAIVGTLLAVTVIAVVTGVVCFFVPGCYFHRKYQGRRRKFTPISTNYDAI